MTTMAFPMNCHMDELPGICLQGKLPEDTFMKNISLSTNK